MSEPGRPELPPVNFQNNFEHQIRTLPSIFELRSGDAEALYKKQMNDEEFMLALGAGYTQKIVERSPFKFVARLNNGALESFALVVRAKDQTNEQSEPSAVSKFLSETLIVASNPNLNTSDYINGERKMALDYYVYEGISPQLVEAGVDIRLKRLLHPTGIIDKARNKFGI